MAEDAETLGRQEEQASYDPLLNHKLEMIDNEEEVFKMLETVDRDPVEHESCNNQEDSSSEEDRDEQEEQKASSSDDEQPLAKRRRTPCTERRQHRLITCPICQQKFKKSSKYEEHMKHHNDLLPFQCVEESCRKGNTGHCNSKEYVLSFCSDHRLHHGGCPAPPRGLRAHQEG